MNRLKELREDKNLYQKDIADYLKVDQSNYSKYELEKINIPLEYLKNYQNFIIQVLIIYYILQMKENLILNP